MEDDTPANPRKTYVSKLQNNVVAMDEMREELRLLEDEMQQVTDENRKLREKVRLVDTASEQVANENRQLRKKMQHVEDGLTLLMNENRRLRKKLQAVQSELKQLTDTKDGDRGDENSTLIERHSQASAVETALRVKCEPNQSPNEDRRRSRNSSNDADTDSYRLTNENRLSENHRNDDADWNQTTNENRRFSKNPNRVRNEENAKLSLWTGKMTITKIGPVNIVEWDRFSRYEMFDGSVLIGDGACYALTQVAAYRHAGKASSARIHESKLLFKGKPGKYILDCWRDSLVDVCQVTMSLSEFDLQTVHVRMDEIIKNYHAAIDMVVEKGAKFVRIVPPPLPPNVGPVVRKKYAQYAAFIRDVVAHETRLEIVITSKIDDFLRTYKGPAFHYDALSGCYYLHHLAVHAIINSYG